MGLWVELWIELWQESWCRGREKQRMIEVWLFIDASHVASRHHSVVQRRRA